MPDGLKYLLAAPGRQKFSVVLGDELSSLHLEDYVQEILTNFSTLENQQKHKIHLVLYALSPNPLTLNETNTNVYNYAKNPSATTEEIFKNVTENFAKSETSSVTNILLIDDFSLLSLLSSNRDCNKMRNFIRKCSIKFQRIFIFSNRDTLSSPEIAILYETASAVAILGYTISQNIFVCDMLKIKPERRITHSQTKFRITNGEIVELNEDSPLQPFASRNQEDVLKTLTTFKLTVEDSEKESRSKLYLPYFDAQKVEIENPDDYDAYDDEDEEV